MTTCAAGESGMCLSARQYLMAIVFFAAIAGLLFGFDTGVISGALLFISNTFHIGSAQYFLKGCIVSVVPFGALVGAILSKKSSYVFGRRRSIMITALMFIVGTLMVAYAQHVSMVIIGRIIMGLAVGLSAMIVPMYLSEISPPRSRGAVVFCFQLAITLGLLMAFVINYIFANGHDWRAMFLVGLVPSLVSVYKCTHG
jgi:MFS family permease